MKDGKYEEALERARAFIERGGEYDRQVMESIFPELKESEDERINKFLRKTFTAQYLCKDKTGKWHGEPVTNILAYLERQKEQQPAEWSEEDEKTIDEICCNLDYLLHNTICAEQTKVNLENRIKWLIRLKSLRPQPRWKPSEEQIEALKYTLGNGGFYDKKALDSLLSDLQKLL